MFSLILGLRPPRYFVSLFINTHRMNIGKINPLKYDILSLPEKLHEKNG
jgi:hypothetical protein